MSQILFPGRVAYYADDLEHGWGQAFLVLPPQRRTISVNYYQYFIQTPYMVYSIKYEKIRYYKFYAMSVLGSDKEITSFKSKVSYMPFCNSPAGSVCLGEVADYIRSPTIKELIELTVDMYWSTQFETNTLKHFVEYKENPNSNKKFTNDIFELNYKTNIEWFPDSLLFDNKLIDYLKFAPIQCNQIGSIQLSES